MTKIGSRLDVRTVDGVATDETTIKGGRRSFASLATLDVDVPAAHRLAGMALVDRSTGREYILAANLVDLLPTLDSQEISQVAKVTTEPKLVHAFHRDDDPRAIGATERGVGILPYDDQGYASIGLRYAFHKDDSVPSPLVFVGSDGAVADFAISDGDGGEPGMEVIFSADTINIYMRQFGSIYLQWRIMRVTTPSKFSDIWRTVNVYEATRVGLSTYSTGQEILNDGEVETAILFAGKAEYSGGTLHGGEELTDFRVMIDGAEVDHTVTGAHQCSRVELVQASDMFEPGDDGEVDWPDDPPVLIMQAWKRWTFEGGSLRLRQHVEHVVDGFTVENAFFGMVPIKRTLGGVQVTHTAARSPKFHTEDVSEGGFPLVYSDADTITVFGDRYSAESVALRGWTAAGRNCWVNNPEQYNKIYFDYFDGEITDTATPWDVEQQITLRIKDTV